MRIAAVLVFGLCAAFAPLAVAQASLGLSASDLAQLGVGADDVRMTNEDGRVVRWGDLNRGPRLVFFGFTHCPVVCPTTLYLLGDALQRLGPVGVGVKVDFVSVDPQRDTPAVLHSYLSSFRGTARGYAGDANSLLQLATAYRAAFRRQPLSGGDYTMDHTTLIYVLDARGTVIDAIAFDTPRDAVVARLRGDLRRAGR